MRNLAGHLVPGIIMDWTSRWEWHKTKEEILFIDFYLRIIFYLTYYILLARRDRASAYVTNGVQSALNEAFYLNRWIHNIINWTIRPLDLTLMCLSTRTNSVWREAQFHPGSAITNNKIRKSSRIEVRTIMCWRPSRNFLIRIYNYKCFYVRHCYRYIFYTKF